MYDWTWHTLDHRKGCRWTLNCGDNHDVGEVGEWALSWPLTRKKTTGIKLLGVMFWSSTPPVLLEQTVLLGCETCTRWPLGGLDGLVTRSFWWLVLVFQRTLGSLMVRAGTGWINLCVITFVSVEVWWGVDPSVAVFLVCIKNWHQTDAVLWSEQNNESTHVFKKQLLQKDIMDDNKVVCSPACLLWCSLLLLLEITNDPILMISDPCLIIAGLLRITCSNISFMIILVRKQRPHNTNKSPVTMVTESCSDFTETSVSAHHVTQNLTFLLPQKHHDVF